MSLSKKTGKVAWGLINPCEGSETLCFPSLTHLCRCTVLGALLRLGSAWECSRHKGWSRGAEHRAQPRSRNSAAPAKQLSPRLPCSSPPSSPPHSCGIQGESLGGTRSKEQGRSGVPPPQRREKQPCVPDCVVTEQRKGTWRCPRVRPYPLDLFFSSWRPSVSRCLGREFRDLLSGLAYLLTWHRRGACGRQSGSDSTPFFFFFLVLISVVPILTQPLTSFPHKYREQGADPFLGTGSDCEDIFPSPFPTLAEVAWGDCHLVSLFPSRAASQASGESNASGQALGVVLGPGTSLQVPQ